MVVLPSIQDPILSDMLVSGKVGVIPTDTVYGLVARASDEEAVARLYTLKHRDHKPGTVIAADVQQLIDLGVPAADIEVVARLWPNPLSVDMLVGDDLAYLHQDTGHCAFRVVDDQEVRALLVRTGPLLTTSANDPGAPLAENLVQAQNYFRDTVDFYVEGGDRSGRIPSTVARYRSGHFEVLRHGTVNVDGNGKLL